MKKKSKEIYSMDVINSSNVVQVLSSTPSELLYPTLIGVIIGAMFASFYGFRFYKLYLVLSGALAGYTFGYATLGMLLGDRITAFDAALILGVASAVIFGLLAPKFYKLYIYILGGLFGFAITLTFTASLLAAMGYEYAGELAGIVLGLILVVPAAKLLYRFFKPVIIISTAFSGSLIAAKAVSYVIFGGSAASDSVFAIVAVLLGVVATVAQFRMNADRDLDL